MALSALYRLQQKGAPMSKYQLRNQNDQWCNYKCPAEFDRCKCDGAKCLKKQKEKVTYFFKKDNLICSNSM